MHTTATHPPATITTAPRHPYATARVAGVLYVIIVVFGLFAEVGVRARLIEPGNPATTAANIADSQWLFRAGFAADLVVFLADVALAVVLYQLLKPISRTLSMAAAAFRLTQTAIIGMNLLNMFNAVRILDDADYLDTFGPDRVESLALLSLDTHKYGYILGLTFFGVATMIIGYMAITSRRMPTALGVATMIIGYMAITSRRMPTALGVVLSLAGAGYVIDSAMFFMIPGYDGAVSPIVLAPAVISEAWFALWLLTRAHRLTTNPHNGSQPPPTPYRIGAPA